MELVLYLFSKLIFGHLFFWKFWASYSESSSLHLKVMWCLYMVFIENDCEWFLITKCFFDVRTAGVGKSCLLLRFSDGSFTTSFITTIGWVLSLSYASVVIASECPWELCAWFFCVQLLLNACFYFILSESILKFGPLSLMEKESSFRYGIQLVRNVFGPLLLVCCYGCSLVKVLMVFYQGCYNGVWYKRL